MVSSSTDQVPTDGRDTSMTLYPDDTTLAPVGTPTELNSSDNEKDDVKGIPDEESPPDGGWRAWLVIFGGFCILLSTFGMVDTFGIFQAYYTQTLLRKTSSSDIAWIGSLQVGLNFLPGLFVGRLFDIGFFHIPLSLASCLFVASIFLTAQCTEYWQFILCQGLALGLSSGLMSGPAIAVVGHWFRQRRALALGIMVTGSSVGGLVFPIAVSRLLTEVGFQWTMRIMGFILIPFVILGNLCMRRRLPPTKAIGGLFHFHAFKRLDYTFYTISCFFAFLGLFTLSTFLNTDATLLKIPTSYSIYLLGIGNASSGVGRIISGVLADRFGPVNIIIIFNVVVMAATFAWPFATNQSTLTVVAVFNGFANGAMGGLTAAPIANMGHIADIGRRIGMTYSLSGIAVLFGPPISGQILTHFASFHAVSIWAGCVIIASLIFLLLTKWASPKHFWSRF